MSKYSGNPHAVKNVNVSQGPRTGNEPRSDKRQAFKSDKAARSPLADTIMRAFGMRGEMTNNETDPGLENISANTRAKFRK